MLTAEDARKFASEWVRHWNERNRHEIAECFAERGIFVDPSVKLTEEGGLDGREAISRYVRERIQANPQLALSLDYVVWDEAQQRLVVVSWMTARDGATRAVELFDFDGRGRVTRGEALLVPMGS